MAFLGSHLKAWVSNRGFSTYAGPKCRFPSLKGLWYHCFSVISVGNNFCCTSYLLALRLHNFSQPRTHGKFSCKFWVLLCMQLPIFWILFCKFQLLQQHGIFIPTSSAQRYLFFTWAPTCSTISLNSPHEENQGMCLPSLKDHSPELPVFQRLKRVGSYILSLFILVYCGWTIHEQKWMEI